METNYLSDAMLKYVFDKLDSLEIGEAITIADYAPNNPELYIQCVDKYYTCFKNIEINNTHTEIRKTYTFNEQIERFQ